MRMLLLSNVGFLPVHFPLLHILRNAVHGVKILEVLLHSSPCQKLLSAIGADSSFFHIR